jgi:5-deoxy-glucuronate isomerase
VNARHIRATGRDLLLAPADAGLSRCGLRVLSLAAGQARRLRTTGEEMIVLPLAGSCEVACDGLRFALAGRAGVFGGVTDFAYLPRDARAEIRSAGGSRLALASARCERRLEPRYGPAGEVPVELRGAGCCSRQVNNFAAADVFGADRLIAVEVLTPGGNWSSYPPHKHDENVPGEEAVLEEIYYFEVARDGIGYQRVYGTPGRPQDLLAEVRTGDVVTIPHGWHGPSMAAPGYDLYYLNVMAGSGERTWLFRDDPAHAWVRDTWPGQPADPRLPMTGPGTKTSPGETKTNPGETKTNPGETKTSSGETMPRPGGDAG